MSAVPLAKAERLTTDRVASGLCHSSAGPLRKRAPYRHRNHRRTGKVARLPAAVRHEICLMFTCYTEYKDIITWLGSQGHPNISECNLSRWRKGGFQDWLRKEEQKRVNLIEFALDVLAELVVEEKNVQLAAEAPSNDGAVFNGSHSSDPTKP